MMRAPLLTPAGAYDKAAIMREGHRQYRTCARLGWSFGRCLSFAWAKARAMREAEAEIAASPIVGKMPRYRLESGRIAAL